MRHEWTPMNTNMGGVSLRKWGVRAVEIQAGFFGELRLELTFKFKFK